MPLQVEGDLRQHEQSRGIRSRYVPYPGAAALPAGPACVGNVAEFTVIVRSVCLDLMLGQKMTLTTFRVQEKGHSLLFPVCFLHLFHFSTPFKENLIYLFYIFMYIYTYIFQYFLLKNSAHQYLCSNRELQFQQII